jgi:hypothetical protein
MNFSLNDGGQNPEPVNIFIKNHVLTDNGKKENVTLAMEKWITEQDSLYNWKISSGCSSPKAQWLIARYRGEDEKAASLEKYISAVPAENRFRLFLRAYNNFNKIQK